jgi:hypothetical protein
MTPAQWVDEAAREIHEEQQDIERARRRLTDAHIALRYGHRWAERKELAAISSRLDQVRDSLARARALTVAL